MSSFSNKSLIWTAGLSLGVHGLFALGLAIAPRPAPFLPPPELTEVRLIEVGELTIPEEMEDEITELVEAVPPAAIAEPSPPPSRTLPSAPSAVVGSTSEPSTGLTGALVPTAPTVDTSPLPGESETDRERRLRAAGVLIDPRRAAADMVLRGDPGPIMPSGPAGLGDPGGESVREMTVAEAEGLHSGYLGAAAATKTHTTRTARPALVPHPDGSYTYRGHAFTATIRPNGDVTFSDRGAVEYDLGSGTGSFDLGDMVMGAAGADPYAAEREMFMEENAELIERLTDEARVATRERSMGRLRHDLRMRWEDRTRPVERRRRDLFRLWDESSEDEGDRAARDAVMAFIRTELPEGSEDAYPASEIAALNARRTSTETFAPY